PLVLVLDDMQWADTVSWDVLEHVVATFDKERILICLTIRAEDADSEVIDRLRRISRDERYHEILLQRLSDVELTTWLDQIFQRQALDLALPALVRNTSDGHPFTATQMLLTLIDDGLTPVGN